jgi:oligosaccharide repeat unit polymerase
VIDVLASPWSAYAVLLASTAAARLRGGSWFAPGAFVGLVWLFFTGGSLIIAGYPVPGRGVWVLVLLIGAIQLGAMIAQELQPARGVSHPGDTNRTMESLIAPCRKYALICTALALFGCLYSLITSLQEFNLPFTPLGVLEVGARWTVLRYSDVPEPWSVRILVTWLHPAGLLGGVLFACSRKSLDRWIGGLTLLPSVWDGALTGARAVVLYGLTCWIGGYVAVQCVRNHGRFALFTGKRVALLIFVAACMLVMFAAGDSIRNTWNSQAAPLEFDEQRLDYYIFGAPAAFAIWYANAELSGAKWGARTFAGELDLLHLGGTRTPGIYTEHCNILGTETTNVYTLFRGLIEDFTVFGAALLGACIGGLAGWVYSGNFENARRAVFWLSMFYAVFLFSPIIFLLSYNGAALAWVIGWWVLLRRRPQPSLVRFTPATAPRGVAL